MNLLSELKPGKKHNSKRLGRGKASGKGGTSTKGHKGQKARSGFRLNKGFEGGQMPLMRRLPKFGFSNKKFQNPYETINLDELKNFKEKVSPKDLVRKGLIRKNKKLKVLARGEIKSPLTITADLFSQKAKKKIEKAGGRIETITKTKKGIKTDGDTA